MPQVPDRNRVLDFTNNLPLIRNRKKQGVSGGVEDVVQFTQQLERDRLFQVNLSLSRAQEIPLQIADRAVALEARTGLPKDLIWRNLEALEKQTAGRAFSLQNLRRSPIVLDWIKQSPQYERLGLEDIGRLPNLEQLLATRKTRWRMTDEQIEEFAERRSEPLALKAFEEQKKPLAGTELQVGQRFKSLEELQRQFQTEEVAKLKSEEDFIARTGKIGFGEEFGRQFEDNPIFMVPYIGDVPEISKLVELLDAATAQEKGTASQPQRDLLIRYGRLMEAMERRGQDVGGTTAKIMSESIGPILEFMTSAGVYTGVKAAVLKGGKEVIEKTIRSSVEGVLKRSIKRNVAARLLGVSAQTLAAAPLRITAGTLQRLTPPMRTAIVENEFEPVIFHSQKESLVTALPKAVVSEWAEMFSERVGGAAWVRAFGKKSNQLLFGWFKKANPTVTSEGFRSILAAGGIHGIFAEVGEERIADLIRIMSGVDPAPLSSLFPEFLGGTLPNEQLLAEFFAFGAFVLPGAALRFVGPKAPDTSSPEFIQEVGNAYLATHLAQSNPAAAEQLVERMAQQGPYTTLFTPKETWDSFWQTQKDERGQAVDPKEKFREVVGTVEPYVEAENQGVELAIPMHRYARNILPNDEARTFFQDEVKTDPDELNPREQKEFKERAEKIDKEQQEEFTQTQLSAARVKENIKGQLRKAGVEKTEAETQAQVVEAVFRTFARRLGIDPFQFFQQLGIRIVREGQPVPAAPVPTPPAPPEAVPPARAQEDVPVVPPPPTPPPERVEGLPPGQVAPPSQVFRFKAPPGGPIVLFQPQGEKGKRGRIEVGEIQTVITLMGRADQSTFLHESAHLYLEILGNIAALENAPQQVKDDFQKILTWLGVKDQAAWVAMGEDRRHQLHERWARGFEQFFLEGKAPTSALRRAFQRFQAWLTEIYRAMKGLNVGLTEEVRRVMDRMLATDEEIEAVSREFEAGPMIENPSAVGMTDQQAQRYNDKVTNARLANREELLVQFMKDEARRRTKAFKEKRKQIRAQVQDDIDAQKEYIALANMQKGTLPNGDPLPENSPAVKLSVQVIMDEFGGRETLRRLPKGITATEGGLHPDHAAEVFGFGEKESQFRSGQHLIDTMIELRAQATDPAAGPSQEAELRRQLGDLEVQRVALEAQREPLASEKKQVSKDLQAGRATLATRLEKAMIAEERGQVQGDEDILKAVRAAGGIAPTISTTTLPKKFRAAKDAGVPSDVMAQNFADNNIIAEPLSEVLFDFIAAADERIKAAKARIKEIPKEAKKLAGRKVTEALDALVENVEEQGKLRAKLNAVFSQERLLKRDVTVNPREAAIERVTDQAMNDEFRDIALSPADLHDAAVSSLHNLDHLALKRAELQYITTNEAATFAGIGKRLTRRPANVREFQFQASQLIGNKKVRDTRPSFYAQAEARAARQAVKTFFAGDLDAAFDAKEREILNHALFLEAKKRLDKAQKTPDFMQKFAKTSIRQRLGKAGPSYLAQMDKLLHDYDFHRISEKEIDRRQALTQWVANQRELGFNPPIPTWVEEEANRRPWRELTFNELQDIENTARNIDTLAKLKTKLLTSKDKREFNERLDDIERSLLAEGPKGRKQPAELDIPGRQLSRVGGGFIASHRTIASLAFQMDGFKMGGKVWELLIRPLNEAGDKEAGKTAEASDALDKLFFKHYTRKEVAFEFYRKTEFPKVQQSFTKMAQLMVALNWGNLDNRDRLKAGRGWTDAQVESILEALDERDWRFVQDMWNYIDTFWPEIRDLSERVSGIPVQKVEAAPVTTRFGVFQGGYFPLIYDGRLAGEAEKGVSRTEAEEEAERALRGERLFATTRNGHRKARSDGQGRVVNLSFSSIFRHVTSVIHDITHYEVLVDSNRVLRDQRFKKNVTNLYGDQAFTQFKSAWRDVAAGQMPAQNELEIVLNWMRTGTSIAYLGLNVSTAMLQPLGLTQSMSRLGIAPVGRAISSWIGGISRGESMVREIHRLSTLMANRNRTFLREVSEVRNSLSKRGLVMRPVESSYFYLITKAQMVADVPTWLAALELELEKQTPGDAAASTVRTVLAKKNEDLTEHELKSIAVADQAVLDTQGGGQVKDLAQIQRGGPLLKIWTQFFFFFSRTFNLTAEKFNQIKMKGISAETIGFAAVDYLLLYAIPASLVVVMRKAFRGDEEEWKSMLLKENLAYMMGTMVLMRDLSSWVQGFDYRGPAGTALMGEVAGLATQVAQGEMDEQLFRKALTTGGIMFHLPTNQAQKSWRGLVSILDGDSANPFRIFLGPPPQR